MPKQIIKIVTERRRKNYEIVVGGNLVRVGEWAKKCSKLSRKVVVVSNKTVHSLYGDVCERSLRNAGFRVSRVLISDGEKHKSLKSAETVLESFSRYGLTRSDAVVALGGGVVGDLAGFAASIYLRGISFLQIPTTLLAMIDSSVGGKTAVNTKFGKNLIGSFYQPNGVFIDASTLATLPKRELTAGYCEMTKHGALSGRKLLLDTRAFLQNSGRPSISELIVANIKFKSKIVAADELEAIKKTGAKSRKILNFGHTLAHALEKATDYRYFKHGEAVGCGILFAAELSKNLALLSEKDVNLLNDVVQCAGPLPTLADIDAKKVFEAFSRDKKNLAGVLQMVLLKGIGKPVIVNETEIPKPRLRVTLNQLFERYS